MSTRRGLVPKLEHFRGVAPATPRKEIVEPDIVADGSADEDEGDLSDSEEDEFTATLAKQLSWRRRQLPR